MQLQSCRHTHHHCKVGKGLNMHPQLEGGFAWKLQPEQCTQVGDTVCLVLSSLRHPDGAPLQRRADQLGGNKYGRWYVSHGLLCREVAASCRQLHLFGLWPASLRRACTSAVNPCAPPALQIILRANTQKKLGHLWTAWASQLLKQPTADRTPCSTALGIPAAHAWTPLLHAHPCTVC